MAAACRAMGIHRSTYYRWRHQVLRFGLDILHPRERRPPPDAQLDLPADRAAGAGVLPRPPHGRATANLRRAQAPQVGRVSHLPQWCSQGPAPPRAQHTRAKRLGLVRLRRAPGADRAGAPRGAPHRRRSPRRARLDGLLLDQEPVRRQGDVLAIHRDRRRLRVHLGRGAPHPQEPVGSLDLGPGAASGPGTSRREGELEALTTDNASEFRFEEFERAVRSAQARHVFIRDVSPLLGDRTLGHLVATSLHLSAL